MFLDREKAKQAKKQCEFFFNLKNMLNNK